MTVESYSRTTMPIGDLGCERSWPNVPRRIARWLALFAAALTTVAAAAAAESWIAVTNQAQHRIDCYESAAEDWSRPDALRWSFAAAVPEYNAREVKAWELPSDIKVRKTTAYAGVARVIVTVASRGLATIASFPEGRRLWSAVVGGNPHAGELLPDGNVAVAASTGGWVRVYAASRDSRAENFAEFRLPDAHGLWWDAEIRRLWALGATPEGQALLTALEVGGTKDQLVVKEDVTCRHVLAEGGPHDLSASYRHPEELWLSVGSHAYRFQKRTGRFIRLEGAADAVGIKALGDSPGGSLIEARCTGVGYDWATDVVQLFDPVTGAQIGLRRVHGSYFYKARPWCDGYP